MEGGVELERRKCHKEECEWKQEGTIVDEEDKGRELGGEKRTEPGLWECPGDLIVNMLMEIEG